jgi:hypothetical protein
VVRVIFFIKVKERVCIESVKESKLFTVFCFADNERTVNEKRLSIGICEIFFIIVVFIFIFFLVLCIYCLSLYLL